MDQPAAVSPAPVLLGVDRCRAGWLAARSDRALSSLRIVVLASIEPVFDVVRETDAIACLDVPIGLAAGGPRRCDIEARRFLRAPRASSVFPTPCRPALEGRSYEEASALNQAASGKKLSRQAYGILPAIREVDRAIRPELQARVHEVHPEVSFALITGRERGLDHPKKTAAGVGERMSILRAHLPEFDIDAMRGQIGRGNAGHDNIFDALACLVTARRISAGVARTFPSGSAELDERGLRMEIVA